MASSLKHLFENPTSPYSSDGEEETESGEEDGVEGQQHTIFSSDEDPPPKSSGEAQMSGRKRLSEGIPTNLNSKQAKKMTGSNTKQQPSFKRLFSEKDEVVLLQGIVGYKGKNPLADKRPLYESMKGSFSFDVTLDQFKDKIRSLKRKYTRYEMRGEVASSVLNPHQRKCFQLSKAIWGADGLAFESSNGKSKESERGLTTKKPDLVTSRMGKNSAQEDDSKRRGDMKKKKKSRLVETESTDWDESCFFLGMDFLKAKWNKVPPTESKKETQEKMKKLHANELECQKFEEMLKVMKDKCAHDKVELLNDVTSLIMAAD